MYAEIFNIQSSPYFLTTSYNLGHYYTPQKITAYDFSSGREGVIYQDSAQFFFTVGDINVDDHVINFIDIPDSVNLNSKEMLNAYLVSEPFQLTDNSTFLYSVRYGISDSSAAVNLLGNSNKYITFKLQLLDEQTSEVLGTYDEVTYNQSNLFQYDNLNYQINTEGIGNRTVYFKLIVNDNFTTNYSLIQLSASGNTIEKTSTIKRNFSDQGVIKTYEISQNFPNPFNPTTKITYQISKPGNVELKVYDILGREVMTLVNDFRNAGKYTVDLNASNLPAGRQGLASGVYFYRIKSGDFVPTKKMVLLK